VRICFIEDTGIYSRTRLWVIEAAKYFSKIGIGVTVLAPEAGWIALQCAKANINLVTYNYQTVVTEDDNHVEIWTDALKKSDIAVCTVHPPREGFHCSTFAARCIKEGGLSTHLITKTGTIVPEYLREFYLPDETIRSSVIAIADFTRRYLIETYKVPAENIALIYQGTDTEKFRHSSRIWNEAQDRYPLPEDASPILGCIGSYEVRKGHPILLRALRELVDSFFPNSHLMLVGDGPEEMKLRNLVVSLGLDEYVSFHSFTREPSIVYERINIAILPSLYKEGLPNVLLEAMSMGTPVIASRLAGTPEVVEDGKTGYLVKPGSVSEIAEAIVRLWSDQKAYSDMARNTRQLMTSRFDEKQLFRAFLEHFESISL
jgi:glycosyltransferase involved in cell wall biosynthesis